MTDEGGAAKKIGSEFALHGSVRYNERMALDVNDMERTTKAIKGLVGKLLTYRRPNGEENANAN